MRLVALSSLLFATACAATPAPQPTTPQAPPPAAPVAPAPAGEPEKKAATAAPPLAVPPPPAECAERLEVPSACGSGAPLTAESLALALEQDDSARDRALACLERSTPNLAAVIRALRADLGPIACADALATPVIEGGQARDPEDENTLVGLMLAARLSRLVGAPPSLAPPFDKPSFFAFFDRELKPWMIAQASAVGQLSLAAARLKGYGKAVAAIEAALSDLRFVQVVRAVPLPAELAADPEVKNVYYAALDEALEPRKARGRDAALVALRILDVLGATADARVSRARALLSELYAGSRIDALDRLLLPELPAATASTAEQRLARRLSPYYAARLFTAIPSLTNPALLRDYLEQGLPLPFRSLLDRTALDANSRFLYAIHETRRGVVYFSGPAFAHAGELVGQPPNGDGAALISALSLTLKDGPKDAAELMAASARPPRPFGSFDALDGLAKGNGPLRGEAGFDAAYLRMLAPTENDAKFWETLAQSFARAARALKAPASRALANEYADSARKTARSLTKR